MARMKLGELLISEGLIDELQLRAALGEQRKWGHPLGRTLVDMKLVDEKTLVSVLAGQLRVPTVELAGMVVPESVLKFLTLDFCLENACLPFRFTENGKFLDVAMADPTSPELHDRIRVATRCNVRPYLAGPVTLDKTIRNQYLGQAAGLAQPPVDEQAWMSSLPGEVTFDMGGPPPRAVPSDLDIPIDTDLVLEEPIAASGAGSSASLPPLEPLMPLEPLEPLMPLDLPRVTAPPPIPAPAAPPHDLQALREEVRRLNDEIKRLDALLQRDDRVIRKLMALLVEKGLFTKDEMMARMKRE